jgi:hypothetical protein
MRNFSVCRLKLLFSGTPEIVVFIMLEESDKDKFRECVLDMNVPYNCFADGEHTATEKLKKIIGERIVDVKGVVFEFTPINEFKFWDETDPSRYYDKSGMLVINTNVYNWYFLGM